MSMMCLVHMVGWEPEGCPVCVAEFNDYKNRAEKAESQLTMLKAENARMREALKDLFEMMDEGLLVRDISKDLESDYHLQMMDFVMRLKKAQSALHPVGTEGPEQGEVDHDNNNDPEKRL